MKRKKGFAGLLALFLAASLMPSLNAYAVQAGTAENRGLSAPSDSSAGLFLYLSEGTTESLSFPLTEAQTALVEKAGADRVTWTLHRTAPYANPSDGKFNPLHGEETMFPHEREEIDLANLTYGTYEYEELRHFHVKRLETSLDGAALTLDFTTAPDMSLGYESMPHENGGNFLDICGSFTLTAELDGTTLATLENVTIKPYASYHTMWEIYDELLRLAGEGDDSSATPRPYVEYGVMGRSSSGYDMPYLIIARDSRSVEKWLELAERAEEKGTAAIEELRESGDEDYQVPILYSNIHANEVAAVDGILEFARMLIEEPSIPYTRITGFTEEGQAKYQAQRVDMGLHTPELVADMAGYLGSIQPFDEYMESGIVEDFDSYYTTEETAVNVAGLLDDVFFLIVLEENVEGRMYNTRSSSNGYDLNRDNCFQTTAETRNMQRLIASYDPVTHVEIHGTHSGFQVEPCTPPHEPNVEYDLISRHLLAGGEAFGAAAVANNPKYQSYFIPMRDNLVTDDDGNAYWAGPWDDMTSGFTPQFAMLHGCVAYTVELPAYTEITKQAACYGLLGLSDYVAANKESYFTTLAEIYGRGIGNRNSDGQVGPWLVDAYDHAGGEAELFRPAHDGEGENGQFFPECYLIPLDAEHQTNLQAAWDMIEWLTRNDVKVGVASAPVTADGQILPAGTAVVSMYQAKRSVANGALYDGTLVCNWPKLYSEGITAFSCTRGFDMVTCSKSAEYEAIAAAVSRTLNYDTAEPYLRENAVSQFAGEAGWDVILSNASEDSTAAVNALLRAGKQVGLITEGEYTGDFLCSYADWQSVADDYVLTGIGMKKPDCTACVIGKAPTVYLSGTGKALTPAHEGYVYTTLVTSCYEYNYDRVAMNLMGFSTTEDAAMADAVVGGADLDAEALAAVQAGVPYVGYTSLAVESVREALLPELQIERTKGLDCLGYVTYPEQTLVNASYILDGDDVFYGYGTAYFTSLPEGAKVLVKRDGSRAPLEGFLNGDEESKNAFLNGIMGVSYAGRDKDGNNVNLTLFADTLTSKGHQRDEYAFISNAIFAGLLTETPYVTATASSGGSGGGGGGGSSSPANTVFMSSITHGTAVSSAASARAGERVTITLKPDEGYEMAGVTVKDASGNAVAVTAGGNGIYSFTMPNTSVSVSPAFVKIGETDSRNCPKDASCPISGFVDAKPDAWYHDGVHWALDEGIMNGVGDSRFAPSDATTRAMIVTMLWRMDGSRFRASPFVFQDVKGDSWYSSAVDWAAANGIVKGYDEHTFGPMDNVTREQLAAILYRYAQYSSMDVSAGESTNIMDFKDVNDTSRWAIDAIRWACGQQIIQGKGDRFTLAPKDNATRAEVAAMLMRLVGTTED